MGERAPICFLLQRLVRPTSSGRAGQCEGALLAARRPARAPRVGARPPEREHRWAALLSRQTSRRQTDRKSRQRQAEGLFL